MDVKFDDVAAEKVIRNMYKNCENLKKETQELLKVSNLNDKWKDGQSAKFAKEIDVISHNINSALRNESEYLETYTKRVIELRG